MGRIAISIFIVFMLLHVVVIAQESCRIYYKKIHDLQSESHHIFYDTTLSMTAKIKISRRKANEALILGYQAIQTSNCNEYGIIIDRMIELEQQLGKHDKALVLAFDRLDRLYPEWKDPNHNAVIDPEHLEVLHLIPLPTQKTKGFFFHVRKNNGLISVCGFEDDTYNNLLNTARFLKSNYGSITSFRFLQNSKLDLNITDEQEIPVWTEIYDLLIDSWLEYEDLDTIIHAYKGAEIIKIEKGIENTLYGAYKIIVRNVPFYFQPRYQFINGNNVEIHPDPEATKVNSLFYKRLMARKSESE